MHQSGVGYYHDWAAGRRKRVEDKAEGGGLGGEGRGARFQLRDLFADEALTGKAVRAQLAELDRLSSKVSVQITGNPLARAESPVMLEGVRDGIDGAYIAESVTHTVTGGGRSGYVTWMDCKTKDGQKGKSGSR